MKVYHNPRCSKSRQALQVLNDNNVEYTVHLYLENPLSKDEINQLLGKLKLGVSDIIRTKEAIWKENFLDKELSNQQLIEILAENPRLLERPILEHNDFAVVARSDDKIAQILAKY